MKRGDLVTIALPGDFGKPRPALIIQSDQFDQTATVTVLRQSEVTGRALTVTDEGWPLTVHADEVIGWGS